MSTAIAHLLEEALLLPNEDRTDLVEAILEQSAPSEALLNEQLETITRRMENVCHGDSKLIPAEEAHAAVLHALRRRE